MSEKRFTINLEDECIDDAEERIFISFLDRIDFYELCGFLNGQQSIINQLKAEKIKLNEENKRLNAFLVHNGFAEEYIRWKRNDEQCEENIYTPSKKSMRFIGGKPLFKREYL